MLIYRQESFLLSLIQKVIQPLVIHLHTTLDHPVIELNYSLCTAVIRIERLDVDIFEHLTHFMSQNPPIAPTPPIDRLFDVAHQQGRHILLYRNRILQQRFEVVPLLHRGILKLIDHKVIESVAHLFIYKRCIISPDQFSDYASRLGDRNDPLLLTQFRHALGQILQQDKPPIIGKNQIGRGQEVDMLIVSITQIFEQRLKLRDKGL